jgi:hypothetical protein
MLQTNREQIRGRVMAKDRQTDRRVDRAEADKPHQQIRWLVQAITVGKDIASLISFGAVIVIAVAVFVFVR